MRRQSIMRIFEILHVGFQQRHIGCRLFVNPQQINADIAFIISIGPAFHRRCDFQLGLLVLGNGIQADHIVVANPLGHFFHAVLFVELQLRHTLNQPHDGIAFLKFFDGGIKRLIGPEHLRAGEHKLRNFYTFQAFKDSLYVFRRALIIIGRTCDNCKTGVIHRFHLIAGHTDIHLQEGLIVSLYRHDFFIANLQELYTVAAQTARHILLQILPGAGIMAYEVNFIALDFAFLHELPPHGVRQRTAVEVSQYLTAGHSRGLTVGIQFLKGGVINSQRSHASIFSHSQHFFCRQAFPVSQFQQILIIGCHVHPAAVLFYCMTYHADPAGSQQSQDYNEYKSLIVLKILHYLISTLFHIISLGRNHNGTINLLNIAYLQSHRQSVGRCQLYITEHIPDSGRADKAVL